ncbi:MAG: transcription-repair coupling factor, partial [Pseudomonadota bacterium]
MKTATTVSKPLEPGEVLVSGAPEGFDATLLATLIERAQHGAGGGGPALHIGRDDRRAAAMADALAVVAPELPVFRFPAWDCLPYDRVSPNSEIVSQRMATLAALADGIDFPCVILSTINAVSQRVPPRAAIQARSWVSGVGGRCDTDELIHYLGENGYHRASTVTEPGDFAVRGGVIDIFPPGADNPVRLDLFGDVLESARRFDAASQRTLEKIKRVELAPISEVLLDEESIGRFRARYRETFGAAGTMDPLYAHVSDGARLQGMEHWLPFYYDQLETLFDYLPGALVSFDHLTEEAHGARWDTIRDHYAARRDVLDEAAPSQGLAAGQVYKPVAPEALYLAPD